MMPCVVKDNDISAKERPKNIYKPKYHAFSIESLVGNDSCRKTNDKIIAKETYDEEEDQISHKITTRTPPPLSPKTGQKFLNKRQVVNEDELVKNGILRSYMTTSHYITSHNQNNSNHIIINNNNHHLSNNSNRNHQMAPRFDTIMRSNINSNSNNVNQNNSNISGVSPFNNQYYCNQMYCRPYDNRFIANTFVPQVCGKFLFNASKHFMPTFNEKFLLSFVFWEIFI